MDYGQVLIELLQRAEDLSLLDNFELGSIKADVELFGERAFGSNKYTRKLKDICFVSFSLHDSEQAEVSAWNRGKADLKVLLQTMIKEYSLITEEAKINEEKNPKPNASSKSKNKIFIVHGHNNELKLEVSNWLYSLEIVPVILHLQPNIGLNSILAKIEENSDVAAAIVLFTADDLGKAKKETELHGRARQNVVFEAGYFVGKLGPKHVIILNEQGVELPGDLSGVIYSSTDGQWKDDLRKDLSLMGLEYKRI